MGDMFDSGIDAITGNSRRAANSQNDLNKDQLALNEFYANEDRGAYGNQNLPRYSGDWEQNTMWQDTKDFYENSKVPWWQMKKATTGYNPAIKGARKSVNRLFNGKTLGDVTGRFDVAKGNQASALQRLSSARENIARTSADTAMAKSMNAIRDGSAGRGFISNGSAANRMRLDAGLAAQDRLGSARLASAEDMARWEMQKWAEWQALQNQYGTDLQLQNAQLPYQMASNAAAYATLPAETMSRYMLLRQQPIDFFSRKARPTPSPGQPYQLANYNPYQGVGSAMDTGYVGYQNTRSQAQNNARWQQLTQQQYPQYSTSDPSMNYGMSQSPSWDTTPVSGWSESPAWSTYGGA